MLSHSTLRSTLLVAGALLACSRQEYLLGALFAAALVPQLLLSARGLRPSKAPSPKAGEPEAGALTASAPGHRQGATCHPAGWDLATLSHELKAPLVGVLGLARILAETHLNPEQCRLTAGIVRSSQNLTGLLDRLLESARLDGRVAFPPIRLRRDTVDLLGMRDDLVAPMRAAFGTPGVCLRSEVRLGGHRFLEGDGVRLLQIGRNLLANALKFTESGEVILRLTVIQAANGPYLRLQVADTGIGIAPHRLSAVLGRYEQEHSGIHGRFGGSGLGLAIVKDLTDSMGGELTVKSVVGVGTTFTAEIPVGLPPEPRRRLPALPAAGNRPVLT